MKSGLHVETDAFVAHWIRSCVVVSVQSVMMFSIGMRDKASASALAFPGRYLMMNRKSVSTASQRCAVAFSLVAVSMQVSGLFLV